MTTEQLKEYLSIVVDMEKNIYLQERAIRELEWKIEGLGHPTIHEEPVKPKVTKRSMRGDIVLLGIMGIVGVLCWWGISLINTWRYPGVTLILAVMGFFFILGTLLSILTMFRERERETAAKESYERALGEYQTFIEEEEQRIREEKARKNVLGCELQKLKEQNEESKERLKQIYASDVIFPKYRNLVMACSLYEYLCAGRCDTLEGREGGYNILEMEIRFDKIIVKLDRVIAQLGAIQDSQYVLYSAIQESNERVGRLLSSAEQIAGQLEDMDSRSVGYQAQISDLQKSSALTAYHAERVEKELAYMNRMDYLTGRNDGVWNNRPPV